LQVSETVRSAGLNDSALISLLQQVKTSDAMTDIIRVDTADPEAQILAGLFVHKNIPVCLRRVP
jgi:hypothetical protein